MPIRRPAPRKGRKIAQMPVAAQFVAAGFKRRGGTSAVEELARAARAAYQSKTKTATRTATTTQYSKKRITQSKGKPSQRRLGNTLVQQATVSNVYSFKSLDADFDGDIGRNVLSKGTPDGITYNWPVYAYNLTALQQGGLTVSPFLRMQSTASAVSFITLNGTSPTGGASPLLHTRNVNGITAALPVQAKSYLDWARMRFVLYGAKNRPMTIRIRLMRFTDESLLPESNGLTGVEGAQRYAAWHTYMKSLVAHPIAGGSSIIQNKYMSVIASKSFNFKASNTTDSDPDPDHRVVDWFRQMNMKLNYTGGVQDTGALAPLTLNDAATSARDSANSFIRTIPPSSKDNVYVVIDCNRYGTIPTITGMTGQTAGPEDVSADSASFDIQIEVSHKALDTV